MCIKFDKRALSYTLVLQLSSCELEAKGSGKKYLQGLLT